MREGEKKSIFFRQISFFIQATMFRSKVYHAMQMCNAVVHHGYSPDGSEVVVAIFRGQTHVLRAHHLNGRYYEFPDMFMQLANDFADLLSQTYEGLQAVKQKPVIDRDPVPFDATTGLVNERERFIANMAWLRKLTGGDIFSTLVPLQSSPFLNIFVMNTIRDMVSLNEAMETKHDRLLEKAAASSVASQTAVVMPVA